jgi:hypothetical protein
LVGLGGDGWLDGWWVVGGRVVGGWVVDACAGRTRRSQRSGLRLSYPQEARPSRKWWRVRSTLTAGDSFLHDFCLTTCHAFHHTTCHASPTNPPHGELRYSPPSIGGLGRKPDDLNGGTRHRMRSPNRRCYARVAAKPQPSLLCSLAGDAGGASAGCDAGSHVPH